MKIEQAQQSGPYRPYDESVGNLIRIDWNAFELSWNQALPVNEIDLHTAALSSNKIQCKHRTNLRDADFQQ